MLNKCILFCFKLGKMHCISDQEFNDINCMNTYYMNGVFLVQNEMLYKRDK